MAFMMPVVKNEFEVYPNGTKSPRSHIKKPVKSSRSAPVTPRLSISPGSDAEVHLIRVVSGKSFSTDRSRSSSHNVSGIPTPKSASHSSLHKFHSHLVDKLRKRLHLQDNLGDETSICDSRKEEDTVTQTP
ncbi:uncharacterized protein LOC106472206 [Limulus polyphemus]|uniref:Uncharacterized protein LOC106472206 n=1 Tax=Limulus polyphemus TaxID=6850 RepID=A0ABM1BTD0_LIMPO|nr:uncharacterized protein LOC106472206 [Limulus polyphemus]